MILPSAHMVDNGRYYKAHCIDLKASSLFRVARPEDLFTLLAKTGAPVRGYDARGVCRLKLHRYDHDLIQATRYGPRGGAGEYGPAVSEAVLIQRYGDAILEYAWFARKFRCDISPLEQLALADLMLPICN